MDLQRQAVLLSLFLRLVLFWSMNGFDGGAQLKFPQPTFPPLWLVDFCEQLPKERFAKPIRKFNFCMECVRMNKDCFFFSVWTLSLRSSHLSKQTHLWLHRHTNPSSVRDEADLKEKQHQLKEKPPFQPSVKHELLLGVFSPAYAVLWSADCALVPVDSLECIIDSYLTYLRTVCRIWGNSGCFLMTSSAFLRGSTEEVHFYFKAFDFSNNTDQAKWKYLAMSNKCLWQCRREIFKS